MAGLPSPSGSLLVVWEGGDPVSQIWLERPFLLAPRLFFLLGLLHSVSLGAFKSVV